ncbi:hypothetical protein R4P57_06945 [Rhodococcus sp. IEGM 1330]|nr:hypothetical protein [Rhodococcus sp. IEGM 1330]
MNLPSACHLLKACEIRLESLQNLPDHVLAQARMIEQITMTCQSIAADAIEKNTEAGDFG